MHQHCYLRSGSRNLMNVNSYSNIYVMGSNSYNSYNTVNGQLHTFSFIGIRNIGLRTLLSPFLSCDYHINISRVKWVPVTTSWRILRLRMEERPPIWRVAANILNSSRGQPTRGGIPAWGLGELLTAPPCKSI
jgi:hypothetical protein